MFTAGEYWKERRVLFQVRSLMKAKEIHRCPYFCNDFVSLCVQVCTDEEECV